MCSIRIVLTVAALASAAAFQTPARAQPAPAGPVFRDGAYYEEFAERVCISGTSCQLILTAPPGAKSLQLSRVACLVGSLRRVTLAGVAKSQDFEPAVEPAALQLPVAVTANNSAGQLTYYYTINQEVSYRIERSVHPVVLVSLAQSGNISVRCHISGKLLS